MILLDTCTLLWLAADQKKLSHKAKKTISDNAGAMFVSSITAFEIGVKCRREKLKLPLAVLSWYAKALECHGITEIPITGQIALSAVELPPHHQDPCDRIIMATAQISSMNIVTCDQLIKQYEGVKIIW